MKIVGIIMVILGSCGIGLAIQKQLQERIWHLVQQIELFHLIQSQVKFHRETMPEICKEIGVKLEHPYKEILSEINRAMKEKKGMSFSDAWQQVFRKYKDVIKVSDKEKEILYSFGKKQGHYDADMQQYAVQQIIEELEKAKIEAQVSVKEKGKLAIWLSAMCGIFIVIVLI